MSPLVEIKRVILGPVFEPEPNASVPKHFRRQIGPGTTEIHVAESISAQPMIFILAILIMVLPKVHHTQKKKLRLDLQFSAIKFKYPERPFWASYSHFDTFKPIGTH